MVAASIRTIMPSGILVLQTGFPVIPTPARFGYGHGHTKKYQKGNVA